MAVFFLKRILLTWVLREMVRVGGMVLQTVRIHFMPIKLNEKICIDVRGLKNVTFALVKRACQPTRNAVFD